MELERAIKCTGLAARDWGQMLQTSLSGDGLARGLYKPSVYLQIIVDHPPALCYPLQDRIQPFLDYLGSLGISSPAKTILQRPSLLGLDGEKSLRQIVDYLQQNDYTPEQIEQLLCTSI